MLSLRLLPLFAFALVALLFPSAITACSLPPGGHWVYEGPATNTTIDTSATCQAASSWTPGNGTQCIYTGSGSVTYCPGVYNTSYGVVAGVTDTGVAACCPYDLGCQTCGSPCVGFQSFLCKGRTASGVCIVSTCLTSPQYRWVVPINSSSSSSTASPSATSSSSVIISDPGSSTGAATAAPSAGSSAGNPGPPLSSTSSSREIGGMDDRAPNGAALTVHQPLYMFAALVVVLTFACIVAA